MAQYNRLSIEQLLMVDTDAINEMDKQTLSNVLKQMSRYVQTRVRAFDKAGESSPALEHLRQEGGTIMSDPSMSVFQMRREWARAVDFLSANYDDNLRRVPISARVSPQRVHAVPERAVHHHHGHRTQPPQ